MLDEYRLVWVEGEAGIGKSALVKEVTHLMFERDVFEDGVLYLSLTNCDMFEKFIDRLFNTILQGLLEPSSDIGLEAFIDKPAEEKYKKSIHVIQKL